MKIKESNFIKSNADKLGIKYLGGIEFDEGLEDALGDVEKFSKTEFFRGVWRIAGELLRASASGAQ